MQLDNLGAPELDKGRCNTGRLAAAPRQRHLVPDRLPHMALIDVVHQATQPQQHRRQPQERQAVLQGGFFCAFSDAARVTPYTIWFFCTVT